MLGLGDLSIALKFIFYFALIAIKIPTPLFFFLLRFTDYSRF